MTHWYNENDRKTAAWLRQLIADGLLPQGVVDERSIEDVKASDLDGYVQCHFFAGIGGWPYALALAGWPTDRPVWTGSCPCQPFSVAGSGGGESDRRHLWPEFRRLISERNPAIVFGEQVASPAGKIWLRAVRSDLVKMARRFAAAGLCAYAVGSPHERMRAFWYSDSTGDGCQGIQRCSEAQVSKNRTLEALDAWHGTGHPFEQWKKLLAESSVCRMADGVSSGLVVRPALRGYGNAIVPALAAEFITAVMEVGENILVTKGGA